MDIYAQTQGNGTSLQQTIPGAQLLDRDRARSVAPGGWFNCSVNLAGPAEDGTVYIHLRETGGQFDRWYSATTGMKREMLATALAALTSGKMVSAYISTTDEYGTINRLYVRS